MNQNSEVHLAEQVDAYNHSLAGCRLQRLEVLNWGTFHGRVWTMDIGGTNALLTGDIGSGKSTLVDALTQLLVPPQRIAFNKAAGADARERTLRSYVLGHYKSERGETSGGARPVPLRGKNDYSVILGVFTNAEHQQTVSLAQVFWMKDMQRPPVRFYIGHEDALTIKEHFSGFGREINNLRKKLRRIGATTFDAYSKYGSWFRRKLGINHEQALELFHQTVSMKSVGNLTEFVREHMLEPFDQRQRITDLIAHFDDLTQAHEAVLKAKRQMGLLQPIVNDCDKYADLLASVERLRECRDALRPFFSQVKIELLDKRLNDLVSDHARYNAVIEQLEEQQLADSDRAAKLRQSISDNGGGRIEVLEEDIRKLEADQARRSSRATHYSTIAKSLGMHPADNLDVFLSQQTELKSVGEATEQQLADLENRQNELHVQITLERQQHDELDAEIESLKSRRSNIDSRQVRIRDDLCAALGVDEKELPFVGELIRVKDEEHEWEGAIERHLRGFGLSLLVGDEHYVRVAQWVDKTHLKGRLVYYRAKLDGRQESFNSERDSLASKLSIRPDSLFYRWLDREVTRRFASVVCCSSHEQFRRATKAITRSGQSKSFGERHEKDDRFRLDDRGRYVLGWSNEAKIKTLEDKARLLQESLIACAGRYEQLKSQQRALQARSNDIVRLEEFKDYSELDWRPLKSQIDNLKEQKQRLESSSNILKSLREQLAAAEQTLYATQISIQSNRDKRSKVEQKQSDANALKQRMAALLDDAALSLIRRCEQDLAKLSDEVLDSIAITVESCDANEQHMRLKLQASIDAIDQKITRLREKIVGAMSSYRSAYPSETNEIDASVDASNEYRAMLAKLISDDLPRFETQFKDLLNVNTINEVVNFQNQLNIQRATINERIDHINQSLTDIDYNEGRYITLQVLPSSDIDVRSFQTDLRACTEDVLTDSHDDQYSEKKFLQVKQIIERFRGREGQADQDARWTTKVVDVRNWFTFAASERWRTDDSEYEHYSDSGGKSGGQKEKLAYTVLAASLAYQFGLEHDDTRSRSFRLVVIDEAFGRGSDESAQFGLELFSRLDLQLLIVTPMQKIHIIEPFVSNVGFVHNEEGKASKLRNLSIQEYREQKVGGLV